VRRKKRILSGKMVRHHSELIRSSKAFKRLVRELQAKYILAGKRPPTFAKATEIIAKKYMDKRLLDEEFIKF